MVLPPSSGAHNLSDYQTTAKHFDFAVYEQTRLMNKTNVGYLAIDRHVESGYGEKIALYHAEGSTYTSYTFSEVKEKIDHYVYQLRREGVTLGDRVYIFLPKNPSCYVAILAAIRIGAIAVPLFEGFMTEALHDRINDSEGKVLITNHAFEERINRQALPFLKTILFQDDLDKVDQKDDYVEWVTPDADMLMHYTSGSTGKPKGVVHCHKTYLHHELSGKWVLDLKDEDVYWCTSHPGWVTGSVYGLLAPWLNRATIVIQEGRFQAAQWFEIIEKLKVTILYSAPTAFRFLKSEGTLYKKYDLSSLRHVLSVGEPLNPGVIEWAAEALKVRIHDTWWMTETGGHIVVNLPSEPIKPGSMGRPFPGITVEILDENGQPLPPNTVGQLAVKAPWPGLMKTIWRNEEKYNSYFNEEGYYLSGDQCYRDEEGYIFFSGRDDDMINAQGERIGPFEVESALIRHPAVKEAGVVGKTDSLRGEIVKAYITLTSDYQDSPQLLEDIRLFVRKHLAAHSAPKEIEVLDALPKTKISGKILRRELKRRQTLIHQ